MKSYPYGNASREKTFKAARLKIFEIIDKSLSELLKKTANQKKVWFLSYIDSKKRIFRRRRANGVAPTVEYIHEKKRDQKISRYCPFKVVSHKN
jgi:hypothetical protein